MLQCVPGPLHDSNYTTLKQTFSLWGFNAVTSPMNWASVKAFPFEPLWFLLGFERQILPTCLSITATSLTRRFLITRGGKSFIPSPFIQEFRPQILDHLQRFQDHSEHLYPTREDKRRRKLEDLTWEYLGTRYGRSHVTSTLQLSPSTTLNCREVRKCGFAYSWWICYTMTVGL